MRDQQRANSIADDVDVGVLLYKRVFWLVCLMNTYICLTKVTRLFVGAFPVEDEKVVSFGLGPKECHTATVRGRLSNRYDQAAQCTNSQPRFPANILLCTATN